MTASDFRPTLTMTTSLVTSTMSPVRIMPGRMRWLARLCSNSWAKLSVIPSLMPRTTRVCTGTAFRCGPGKHNGHPLPARAILRTSCSHAYRDERPLRPQATSGSQFQHPLHHRLDRKTGRVDDTSIGRRLQGGDLTGLIPQIPLGYLARKGRKANTGPLVFQLLMPPESPLLRGGSEEDFKLCPGKDDRAHIATVRHQARGYCKGALPGEQPLADPGPGRHPGGSLAGLLGA